MNKFSKIFIFLPFGVVLLFFFMLSSNQISQIRKVDQNYKESLGDLQTEINELKEKVKDNDEIGRDKFIDIKNKFAELEKESLLLYNQRYITLLEMLGGIGGTIAFWFAWRNQTKAEENTQKTQITQRLTESLSHLGSEKISISMGGIYALERIANESPKDRLTIINILGSTVIPVESTRYGVGQVKLNL